jgi:hypothetical protein
MITTFVSRVRLIVLFLLMGFPVFTNTAWATHPWSNYHWARQSNPFTLKVGDNVSSTWDPYLATTSSDWSLSSVLDTSIVLGKARPKSCRAVSGTAQICNALYGANGWLGVARIWAGGDSHITQATVKLNDTYFNTATYDTVAWRTLVMCQEVGHVFGLAHQDEDSYNTPLGSCMDYSIDPVPNQHPNDHDYEQLEIIYAHLDTTVTVGQIASQTARGARRVGAPAEWGRLMRRSRNGRIEWYRRDLEDGQTVSTMVIWADGDQ